MRTLFAGLILSTSLAMPALAANPIVEMQTSKGPITLELNAEKAPKTVENFLAYTKAGFYNGTVFHRVIDSFMIQGGGFEPGMKQKATNPPIVNESQNGLANEPGTIAMARTQDPNSATAQFFINLVDNKNLNYPSMGGYAVFGKVIKGMETVQAIAKVKTGNNCPFQNVPTEDVVIQSAKIVEAPAAKK